MWSTLTWKTQCTWFKSLEKTCFHVPECWIGCKINVINYRNTTEPTSVPHSCVSVKRGLEIYEKLVPNIQMKSCETAGQMLTGEMLNFSLFWRWKTRARHMTDVLHLTWTIVLDLRKTVDSRW